MRGEYECIHEVILSQWELPPRARRILNPAIVVASLSGTTSACAENTSGDTSDCSNNWNYLRVRGEYITRMICRLGIRELPPRARRILQEFKECLKKQGTTSACAENTPHGTQLKWIGRNYLRVRGEYASSTCMMSMMVELPPRARRIP